jgi:uncharacterized protein YndB with AHSA1/START domain
MIPKPVPLAVVKRSIRVEVPVEKAFQVFVGKMATWWPAEHHIGEAPFVEVVVEPREGGRWFERDSNRRECDWGRVLLWQPPRRLILSWNLQTDWKFSADQARASEVALEFITEGPSTTRLEFQHRHIERHGEGYETLIASVDSPGGWTMVLDRYSAATKA